MYLIISFSFALLIFLCCLLVGKWVKNINLNPFLAFSSGGFFSIAVLDFLPSSFARLPDMAGVYLALGIFIQSLAEIKITRRLGFLDKYIQDSSSDHKHSHIISPEASCSLIGCLIICSFFDGTRFYAGLTLDLSVAVATGFVLFFHLLSEGLMLASLGKNLKLKQKVCLVLFIALCLSFFFGASTTSILFHYGNADIIFSIASGILLYVCFMHLLPFCLKHKYYTHILVGFLIFSTSHFLSHH